MSDPTNPTGPGEPGGTPPPPPPPPAGYPPPPPPAGYAAAGGAPAAYGGAQLAEWPARAQSALVDWFGPAVIAGVLGSFMGSAMSNLLGLAALAWALYQAYQAGQTGQSMGKQMAGTRLLNEQTGLPIGGGLGIVRHIAHFVDAIICYIGFLFPLWDSKKQTIADKIMKTVVVRA